MENKLIVEKGLYMRFVQPDSSTVIVSNPDVDMPLEVMLSQMRVFCIACGYSESQVNEVFGDI